MTSIEDNDATALGVYPLHSCSVGLQCLLHWKPLGMYSNPFCFGVCAVQSHDLPCNVTARWLFNVCIIVSDYRFSFVLRRDSLTDLSSWTQKCPDEAASVEEIFTRSYQLAPLLIENDWPISYHLFYTHLLRERVLIYSSGSGAMHFMEKWNIPPCKSPYHCHGTNAKGNDQKKWRLILFE